MRAGDYWEGVQVRRLGRTLTKFIGRALLAELVLLGAVIGTPAKAATGGKVMWYSADLVQRLDLATQYLCAMLDKDRDDEPYFHITRREDGTAFAGHAIEIGIPHVTGRALDALFFIEEVTGKRPPSHCEATYTRYLLSCYDNEDHLPSYYDPRREGKRFVEFHNLREGLEGLTWLIKLRDNATARDYAHRMLQTLARITDADGALSLELVRSIAREGVFHGIGEVQTVTAGRLVGALVKYYRVTGDPLALELADEYAHHVMSVSFTREGVLTDLAGNHIHSITSTLSGVLDFALMTSDWPLVEAVRRAYEVGLREFYSTYGWCKEQAWLETDQGEVNQIGDLIQVQLLLAGRLGPSYYSQAETWMRSGLLPSQVLESDFIEENPQPKGDFERDMKQRIIGGFGFPTPSSHLQTPHSPINTIDITEGAVQAICEFARHIVTRSDLGVQVNLLFSWENDLARVDSDLPLRGRLRVTVKKAANLLVRVPRHIEPGSLRATCEGKPVEGLEVAGYLLVPNDQAGPTFEITFEPQAFTRREFVYHKPYEVRWFGEQATGISPVQGLYPLFGQWPGDEE
ncbi:MAG: hypothetical protein J7M26_08310 [Armatimonadetes bacterium]|nr:hypothetical protein [Armatimonadota bacterium]